MSFYNKTDQLLKELIKQSGDSMGSVTTMLDAKRTVALRMKSAMILLAHAGRERKEQFEIKLPESLRPTSTDNQAIVPLDPKVCSPDVIYPSRWHGVVL